MARESALAAAVILAGGLRPTPLAESANCSVLDLWLTPCKTVLDLWLERVAELGDIGVCILWNHGTPRPTLAPDIPGVELVEDQADYRGPAGSLCDACRDIAPEQSILVGEATRFLGTGLSSMLEAHVESNADVTVACNRDRTPAGVYMIKRRLLDLVPALGFMDLKEQWLGKVVGSGARAIAHTLQGGDSHVLRTREQFLAAAAIANGGTVPGVTLHSQGESHGDRVVSEGALVHESASLWGSVVMGRARIDAGAVVVRSLISPGAHVPPSAVIVDRVVPATANVMA